MKKKFLVVLLSIMLCFTMIACNETIENSKTDESYTISLNESDDSVSIDEESDIVENSKDNQSEQSAPDDKNDASENSNGESQNPDHTHEFSKSETIAPSCIEKGYTQYQCECGATEQRDFVDLTGHSESDWIIVTPATENSDGLKKKECTICKETLEEEPISKLSEEIPSHTHYEEKTTEVIAPTCTEKGYTLVKCICGATKKEKYVSAKGHINSDWVVVTEATEQKEGLKQKTCTVCKAITAEQAIPKISNDPTAKFEVLASDNPDMVREATIYYINQYRIQEGKPIMTALNSGKTQIYADIRAEQISTNFAHDRDDEIYAATQAEFGEFVPEEPEVKYDSEKDEIYYTGNIIPAHYEAIVGEAIADAGVHLRFLTTANDVGMYLASMVYNSKPHWSYIGHTNNIYLTIGLYDDPDEYFSHWYASICANNTTEYD